MPIRIEPFVAVNFPVFDLVPRHAYPFEGYVSTTVVLSA